MSAIATERSEPALEVSDVSHWFGATLALDKVFVCGAEFALHRSSWLERRREDDFVFSRDAAL